MFFRGIDSILRIRAIRAVERRCGYASVFGPLCACNLQITREWATLVAYSSFLLFFSSFLPPFLPSFLPSFLPTFPFSLPPFHFFLHSVNSTTKSPKQKKKRPLTAYALWVKDNKDEFHYENRVRSGDHYHNYAVVALVGAWLNCLTHLFPSHGITSQFNLSYSE